MAAIIEARGLTKHFGDVRALDCLDLVARSGQVTALLGPNGAGKTTFVRAVGWPTTSPSPSSATRCEA
jgi:ABC-type multidrug transport system ATPase subunit